MFDSFFLFMLQNELAILEFIHLLVETMDRHFGNVVSSLLIRMNKFLTHLENTELVDFV